MEKPSSWKGASGRHFAVKSTPLSEETVVALSAAAEAANKKIARNQSVYRQSELNARNYPVGPKI